MIDVNEIKKLVNEVARLDGYQLPSGATSEDCDGFSQRTGITMPPELREWLLLCNGPNLRAGGFYGIPPLPKDSDIESVFAFHPTWHDNGWLPIANDGCGDYFVVPTRAEFGKGCPVLFIDAHEDFDIPSYIVASGVGKLLESLLRKAIEDSLHDAKEISRPSVWPFLGEWDLRDRWPFDEALVRAADPDIVRFRGVPLPWDLD